MKDVCKGCENGVELKEEISNMEDVDKLGKIIDNPYEYCPIGEIWGRIIPEEVVSEYLSKITNRQSLSEAISKGEIHLEYQPVVNMHTNEIVAVESLARWTKQNKKIPPSFFIPIAEETLIINQLGRDILHESCRQNKEWQDKGLKKIKISVNVSYAQMYKGDMADQVRNALETSGLEPQWLGIEVTETGVIPSIDGFKGMLNEIRDMGVEILIDDFGTEYSSLNHLKSIKADGLKIDKSFIDYIDVEEEVYSRKITESIVNLAKDLGMGIVVEGVETKAQLEVLRELGCDRIQGYLYSKPVDSNEIEKLLEIGKIIV